MSNSNDFCKGTGYIFRASTGDSFTPYYRNWHDTFGFGKLSKGAKVPQKVPNLFVKTVVFTQGNLGGMITLCMSTKKYAFEAVDSRSASSLYNFLKTFALSS